MTDKHSLIAFLTIIAAIVFMAWLKVDQAVLFGLVGIAGTFKPRTNGASNAQDDALKTLADKVPPQTGEAA